MMKDSFYFLNWSEYIKYVNEEAYSQNSLEITSKVYSSLESMVSSAKSILSKPLSYYFSNSEKIAQCTCCQYINKKGSYSI